MSSNVKLDTRELVFMGLMIALICISGSVIRVPSIGGFVHIGDCMVFLSVILLGKKKGAVCSGLGMLLVDVLAGYYIWAPFTLIIKATMAYICGTILEKMSSRKKVFQYITAFVVSGIFMIFGYFVARILILMLITKHLGLLESVLYASKDVLGNIIQIGTASVLALPLSGVLVKSKKGIFS